MSRVQQVAIVANRQSDFEYVKRVLKRLESEKRFRESHFHNVKSIRDCVGITFDVLFLVPPYLPTERIETITEIIISKMVNKRMCQKELDVRERFERYGEVRENFKYTKTELGYMYAISHIEV